MAKKRKTRKDKIHADLRHSAQINTVINSVSLSPQKQVAQPTKEEIITPSLKNYTVSPAGINYTYVKRDLSKTTIVTAAIVITEFFLLLLTKH